MLGKQRLSMQAGGRAAFLGTGHNLETQSSKTLKRQRTWFKRLLHVAAVLQCSQAQTNTSNQWVVLTACA